MAAESVTVWAAYAAISGANLNVKWSKVFRANWKSIEIAACNEIRNMVFLSRKYERNVTERRRRSG